MVDGLQFDTFNLYQSLEYIQARSPQELIDMIKLIRTPVKIVNIVVQPNGKYVAFIVGDIRKNQVKGKANG